MLETLNSSCTHRLHPTSKPTQTRVQRRGRKEARATTDGPVILLDQKLDLVLVRAEEDDVAKENVAELNKVGEMRNRRSPEKSGLVG